MSGTCHVGEFVITNFMNFVLRYSKKRVELKNEKPSSLCNKLDVYSGDIALQTHRSSISLASLKDCYNSMIPTIVFQLGEFQNLELTDLLSEMLGNILR